MAIVLALLGYGTFLYGYERAGVVVLGLAIGVLWAEERRRLTSATRDPTMGAQFDRKGDPPTMKPIDANRRSV